MYEPGHNYYERLQQTGNILITRASVGQAKPSIVPLPPANYVFGQARLRDKERVADVLTSWEVHHASKGPQPPRDFKALNVLSLRSGLHTCKAVSHFRTMTDAKVRIPCGKLPARLPAPIPDVPFGIKVRASTPMNDVMSNAYGRIASNQRHELYGLSKTFAKPRNLRHNSELKVRKKLIRVNSLPIKQTVDLNKTTG